MLNYICPPELLEPFVPAGTALDTFEGRHYVSLVGFRFLDTRVLGVPVPLHRNFEEVNLRFYVKRNVSGEIRRGVVFIREIVPRRAIAAIANRFYHERYVAMPMSHRILPESVEYRWRTPAGECGVRCDIAPEPEAVPAGSEAEFITEHYHGYVRRRDGRTGAYRVVHPRWRCHRVSGYAVEGDFRALYGPAFGDILSGPAMSVFVAEGSPVTVSRGTVS